MMEATKQEVVMPAKTPVGSVAGVVTTEALSPTTLDACDRCGAAGLWHVLFASGNDLVLCGHHAVVLGFVDHDKSHAAYREENRQQGSSS